MPQLKTLVCLPTLNEEESIGAMIDKIRAEGFDLIISDSNSGDRTAGIAADKNVELFQRKKPGKAAGVREAMAIAKERGYDVFVYMDCDNTYPPSDIKHLVRLAADHDVVIGARTFKEIALIRRFVNVFHTGLLNFLFGSRYHDVNSGFRAFRLGAFTNSLSAEGMELEVQVCCKAAKMKIPVAEYNISHYAERTGESTITAIDFFAITFMILKEYFRKD